MNKPTHSPFVQVTRVETPDQTLALMRQVQSYAEFLEKKLKEIPSDVGIDPVIFFKELEFEILQKFGLRCVYLEFWIQYPERIPQTMARKLLTGIVRFLWLMASAYHPNQKEKYIAAVDWFNQIDPEILPLLSVYRSDSKPELRNQDYLGWHIYFQSKECAGIILELSKLREAADRHRGSTVTFTKSSSIRLNQSQRESYQKLEEFYLLKSKGETLAGYDFRPIPLMVGLSGVGKTSVVSHFAKENKLPMLSLNCGGWLISGSKSEIITMTMIRDFVRDHEKGVLFIDELDKFGGNTDWCRFIQQEIYALIDRRLESFVDWHPEIIEKFKDNFFVIGAGTWQSSQKAALKSVGFIVENNPGSVIQGVLDIQDSIPEELLFRFNADIVHIQPMNAKEFEERIKIIHEESKYPVGANETYTTLADKAVKSGKQNRWLEAYVSKIMREKIVGGFSGTKKTKTDGDSQKPDCFE